MFVFMYVFVILFIGLLFICSLIGIFSIIDIIGGQSKNYLSYNGCLYKKDNQNDTEDIFIHIKDNKIIGYFNIYEV